MADPDESGVYAVVERKTMEKLGRMAVVAVRGMTVTAFGVVVKILFVILALQVDTHDLKKDVDAHSQQLKDMRTEMNQMWQDLRSPK